MLGPLLQQKGFGSVVPVSVQDCQIACETAAGCDSFTYNPVQRQCFLKNGSGRTTCQVLSDSESCLNCTPL